MRHIIIVQQQWYQLGSKRAKAKNTGMNEYRDFSMNVNTPEYIIENDKKISKERTQEIIDDLNKYLKK